MGQVGPPKGEASFSLFRWLRARQQGVHLAAIKPKLKKDSNNLKGVVRSPNIAGTTDAYSRAKPY